MARRLHDAVVDIPGVTITQRVQANGVFAILPEQAIAKLQEAYHFYAWDEGANEVRWMCSWDTTEDDIDSFARLVAEVVPASL
jgi:threonine aldolase